jgi:hypothetical protein
MLNEHLRSVCVDCFRGQHLLFREEQAFLSMQLPFHMQLPVLGQKERKETKVEMGEAEDEGS